jgi:glycosyltransferase involved in cell wall biosynthesis
MPYIVLETLAAGKPMIASAVGGIPEIFGAASAALVEPTSDSVGEKMRQALADLAAYRRQMPDLAMLKARFGADVMARDIEKAYFAALRK